ncbi:lipid II:glycine glycyltransferase FemX [Patescibacteria group bacterium]
MSKFSKHPLQSKEWATFRKEWGNRVIKFKYGYVIATRIPKSKYSVGTFIKGPEPTKDLLDKLKKVAHKNNLIYIKIEPDYVPKSENTRKRLFKLLKNNGCVSGKTLFTPSTFIIDLSKSDEDLMKSFSGKTRYNIRLAGRRCVNVTEDNSDKAFETYLELTRNTVERQGFYAHSEKYHKLMWKHLRSNKKRPVARLLKATFKKEIIATWILFVGNKTLYYPYGASSHKHKNVMASNLMMWEAIQLGKKLGLEKFDLWGREEGKGFTKFKEGYSPIVEEFLGTWDLVTSKLYWPYRVADKLRWIYLRLKSKSGFVRPSF